jgi:hypothetical protein
MVEDALSPFVFLGPREPYDALPPRAELLPRAGRDGASDIESVWCVDKPLGTLCCVCIWAGVVDVRGDDVEGGKVGES